VNRVGQLWRVQTFPADDPKFYLVLDEGRREGHYKRWLHRAMNIATGSVTELQEVDGSTWEDLPGCARFG